LTSNLDRPFNQRLWKRPGLACFSLVTAIALNKLYYYTIVMRLRNFQYFLLFAFATLLCSPLNFAQAENHSVNCSVGGSFSVIPSTGVVVSQNNCAGIATFPDYTKIVAAQVFMNARALTEVKFNVGLTVIGDSAFASAGLTSINLPPTLIQVGQSAFSYLSKVTKVEFPDSLTSIGSGAFSGTSLTSLYVPASVIDLGGCFSFY